jgi:hypothetical protein
MTVPVRDSRAENSHLPLEISRNSLHFGKTVTKNNY